MTSAALANSGLEGGSNFSRYNRPAVSRMRNPGVMPSFLAAMTVQQPSAGAWESPAPRCSSARLMRREACRLVYQALSGTSSTVLIPCEGMLTPLRGACSPGVDNVFSKKS
jgi:hypothetical protein